MVIKAIETEYKGYKFRSRLEARWAVFFDNAGIEWMYEPEGYKLSDGTMYLPDFYLPGPDCFFEVKGVMTDVDKHKIEMLIRDSEKPVIIGDGNMEFTACDFWPDRGTMYWEPKSTGCTGKFTTCASPEDSCLVRCENCGRLYFMGMDGVYDCYHCEGDYKSGHWRDYDIRLYGERGKTHNGRHLPMEYARTYALKARFEHGENPDRLQALRENIKSMMTPNRRSTSHVPRMVSDLRLEDAPSREDYRPPLPEEPPLPPQNDAFRPVRNGRAVSGPVPTGAASRQTPGASHPGSAPHAHGYTPPAQNYAPPAQGYTPPAQSYTPPAQNYAPPVQKSPPPASRSVSMLGSRQPPSGSRRGASDWWMEGDRSFWPTFVDQAQGKADLMIRPLLNNHARMGGIWCEGTLTIWVENEWARSLVNRPHNISTFRAVARDMFGIWPRVQIVVGRPTDPLPPPEQVEAGPQVPERDAMDDLLQFSGCNNIDII